jgi:hypothetical protein
MILSAARGVKHFPAAAGVYKRPLNSILDAADNIGIMYLPGGD